MRPQDPEIPDATGPDRLDGPGEERLALVARILESLQNAVVVASPDGIIVEWNPAAERLYGYSRAEALGQPVAMLYRPETLDLHDAIIRAAIESGHASFDGAIFRKDGSTVLVAGTVSTVTDPSGAVKLLVGISRDVSEEKALIARLEESEERLAEAQRVAGVGSYSWDLTTGELRISDQMCRLFGIRPDEFEGTFEGYLARVHPDDRPLVLENVHSVYEGADGYEYDHRMVRPDGELLWLRGRGHVVRDEHGNLERLVGTGLDVTEAKRADQALQDQRDRLAVLAAVVESTDDAVIVFSEDGTVLSWNEGAHRLYGYTAQEMIGRNLSVVRPDGEPGLHEISARLGDEAHARIESADVRRDGSTVPTSATISRIPAAGGAVTALVAIVRDVTQQKHAETRQREQSEQLIRLAFHDPLTGLANRSLLHDRLAHSLARRDEDRTSVLLLDLDNFKTVNDLSGHAAGDRLLVEIARRLASCVRAEDTVSRLGGDEFAILIHDADAEELGRRVLRELSAPVTVGDRQVIPAASVGIADSRSSTDPDELLLHADVAMYAAKAAGKDRMKRFTPDMAEAVRARADTETALREAVARDEIIVHYQPIIDVRAGSVSRVEALVRWQRPTGTVSPTQFLGLAEDTGLIAGIGREVLRRACAELGDWLAADEKRSMAVNVSTAQLEEPDFGDHVLHALSGARIPTGQLVLEVTETLFLDAASPAVRQLSALRADGVRVSIDDFGTGYSSLGRLQDLPVDSLKIDRSFVEPIRSGQEDVPLLTSIVLMAHNLGLDVTAEGVETMAQAARLIALECDYLQGFNFATAEPAARAMTDGAAAALRRFSRVVAAQGKAGP